MPANVKARGSSKSAIPSWEPQFLTDANGTKTAVVVPLEAWERVAPFLQSDLVQALLSEPIDEEVSPRMTKRLRDHKKGKKGEMLTLEDFHAEVERLRSL
jgi:hypothetical protein